MNVDYEFEDYDGVLVGSIRKRSREEVRVGVREFRGNRFIDIRTYYQVDDEWRPSQRGVTLPTDAYPELADLVIELGTALGFVAPAP